MNDPSNLVSIIIPAYKRHKFLIRILDYYKNSKIPLYIANSTPEKYTQSLGNNVNYFHYPNFFFCEKILDVLQKIKTQYVVFCGDDDFIVPTSIIKCVEFLEKNKDFATAEGRLIDFNENTLEIRPYNKLGDNDRYYNKGNIEKKIINYSLSKWIFKKD